MEVRPLLNWCTAMSFVLLPLLRIVQGAGVPKYNSSNKHKTNNTMTNRTNIKCPEVKCVPLFNFLSLPNKELVLLIVLNTDSWIFDTAKPERNLKYMWYVGGVNFPNWNVQTYKELIETAEKVGREEYSRRVIQVKKTGNKFDLIMVTSVRLCFKYYRCMYH